MYVAPHAGREGRSGYIELALARIDVGPEHDRWRRPPRGTLLRALGMHHGGNDT